VRGPAIPPVVVLHDRSRLDEAVDSLGPSWWARRGFDLPDEPWELTDRGWCCTGEVGDPEGAADALLALVRGCALVVVLSAPGEVGDAFLADVSRAGAPHSLPPRPIAGPVDELDEDERALLALLADGRSVADAAGELYLSLRTAQRRLGAARRRLGVATTREAVVAWRRHHAG
jgi:DNA-binding CsgD family transcriptional regulator